MIWIMPNHVHVLFAIKSSNRSDEIAGRGDSLTGPIPLQTIMQSLKRHTARQANKILGRQGPFWQEESFDRVVRNSPESERIIEYIINNPVTAGFVDQWEDWPWSYCKPGLK